MDAAAEAYRDVFTASPEQAPPKSAAGNQSPPAVDRNKTLRRPAISDNLLIGEALSLTHKSAIAITPTLTLPLRGGGNY